MAGLRAALAALAVLAWTQAVGAAPQTFNTALPVAEGQFILREQFFFMKADDDPGPAGRDLEVWGGLSVLGYGLTGDLALFGALPVLDKTLSLILPGGARVTRNTRGIGDARLFGRYTIFRQDAPGRTFRIAPFAGLEFPTGDDDDSDSLGVLPAPLQLGSGSWDPFAGLVATLQTLDYQIDLQASYQANTQANGFEFGDEARLDGSFQYRLWPRELNGGTPAFLYGALEANLIYRDQNAMGGAAVADSGGTSLFIAPGLQYVTQRLIIEAIAQIPLFQDLNRLALEDSYTLRAGLRVNF